MTQYFTSEEIFNNTNGLGENLNYYNGLIKEAGLSFDIEGNIIYTGGKYVPENKVDECAFIRKLSMGVEFVIYERRDSGFHLIRLSQMQIKNLYKVLKLEKLKAFL